MRKSLIPLFFILLMMSFPIHTLNNQNTTERSISPNLPIEGVYSISEAGGSGNSLTTTVFLSKSVSGEQISILNTYTDTADHSNQIDLSAYQISGWQLYQVDLAASNIEAAPEREVIGVTHESGAFSIVYIDAITTFFSQLAQGFYNQSHNGILSNYSIYYSTVDYDPSIRGNASFVVASDSDLTDSNPSTPLTTPMNISGPDDDLRWDIMSGENIALDANTIYWAMINGSTLYQGGAPLRYPAIYWYSENSAGTFPSYQHGSSSWDPRSLEALMNYTYVPWNRTSNSALTYQSPESIALNANGSAQTGLAWNFTSVSNNITSITFSTNQSVYFDYDLALWYKKASVGTTNWGVDTSGNPINWNVSLDLTYPVTADVTGRFMNITGVPSDWIPNGLYLGSSPSGSQTKIGSVVYCSGLSDGSWTLTSTAPNYVVDLALSDSSDSSPIIYKVANLVIMDVDATIEDGIGTPMNGGNTTLSVLQSTSLIYSPVEIPASGGAAGFQWDISSTTSGNSTHSVEVYWLDATGLEAGYITQEVFVFHSTTLVADDYSISAYTDNTFDIGIDFNSISPANGLDEGSADVTFSFGSIITNDSLVDAGGGRWTMTVSTATMTSGAYILTVYAEGYALENQSLTIDVELSVETQPLEIVWAPTDTITFLESTNLTVAYNDATATPIPDAWVNVTFDSTTYDLKWDGVSEFYWIQLNGTDFVTVPGPTTLEINAWKAGYTSQYNGTTSITINEEPSGTVLVVTWNPSDRNITYIESITITASYTYNSNPINDTWDGVWVRVTFSGYDPVNMTYNPISYLWEVTLDGSDYLGVTTVTIRASATGYGNDASTPVDLIVVEDIPILTNSWTDSAASTDYATNVPLQVTVRDSSGAFINDATLTLNAFGVDYPMSFLADGIYEFLINPNETRGVHVVSVTMVRVGYRTSLVSLDLTVRATTSIDIDYISQEYEQWNLTITATYTDTFYSTPITGATVSVTIDGVEFTLIYDNGAYTREILLDFDPGTYTITVVANAPFCNEATDFPSLQIDAKSAVYLSLTTEGDPSAQGQVLSIIATLRYNDSDLAVPDENIHFIVTIYYVNGTVEIRNMPSQYDTTNDDGVALWGFEIPSGSIDRISILAEYLGSRVIWATSFNLEFGVGANPLILILSFFFMSDIGRMIVLSMIILGVVATAYNKRVKPKKRAARKSLENQLQMFRDLESLRHFMAVYLDRGTCVFYHPLTDERIQPDLISGFIAAITSVYGEIKGDGVRGTLEEIQYHGLRLNSYSGEFIIGILILEGEMTPLLKERLQFFVELFENQYDQHLTDWNGLIDCFDPEWVVSTLNSAFNYSWLLAHRFGPTQKIGKTDARILDYISAVRDERNEFYFRDLLIPLAEMLDLTEAEVLDRLLILQDNGVIVPVNIQTILQRQGMGLANGEMGPDSITLEFPEKEEVEAEPLNEPDDLEYDEESLMTTDSEEKEPEVDEMDAFVKDVESLLTKEKEENEES